MVLGKLFEPPDLVAITLTGLITADDQAAVVEWVRAATEHVGQVRLLIVLDGFTNWVPDATSDSRMWLSEDDEVSHIAIVGNREWRTKVLTIIAQPIRRLPIRYFEAERDAREWLRTEPLAAAENL